jgi:nucleotide-binding universal stress UspA family protein
MSKPVSRNPPHAQRASARSLAVAKATIVCGTDFSQQAIHAVETAAALARRLDEALLLVHAVDTDSHEFLPAEIRDSLCTYERAQLHEEFERLRAAEVEVSEAFRGGKAENVLLEAATSEDARLVVVSSHGRKLAARWVLGSVAERVAESSPVPTLVVRDSTAFTRWLSGKKHLRVFVGADFSAPSKAALQWVAWLQQIGPCHVVVAHLEADESASASFGPMHPSIVMEMLARTNATQVRAMRRSVRQILGVKRVRVRIEKGWARSDAHLIQVAREERADLMVIGTHQRHGLARLGHLSVSRGVLHYAPMNVACVPFAAPPEEAAPQHRIYRDGVE